MAADTFHSAGDEEVPGGSTCQARHSPFRRLMLLGNVLPQASDFASMVVLRFHTNAQHTPFASEITPSCRSIVQCSAVWSPGISDLFPGVSRREEESNANGTRYSGSLGRMGLLLLSNDQPQQAVTLLEEAQGVPIQSLKIRSWHAVIEAEAYSYLGNSSACRKALAHAKDTSEATFLEADIYATGFTRARLASYEGSCYLRLNQPESALPVLEQALLLIDPAAIRRLARLLTYLGQVHIRLEHERQAYEYASQALDLTCQTQSLDILRHVRKLRDDFLTRGESSYTKDLDRHIEETQAVIAAVGGFHG